MLRLILSLLMIGLPATTATADALFAVAVTPAPVLNRADFSAVFGGKDGKSLLTDKCGQLRAVEFIALPGTVFTIQEKIDRSDSAIYRVTTADYPYPSPNGYFVDGRSLRITKTRPAERARVLPQKEHILAALEKRVGTRYVWGGNIAAGVAELTDWYPPAGVVDKALRQLAGVDCSGILYEATGGYTPRNTSSLVKFGKPVSIAGKTVQQIAAQLLPLDLIVWSGHVLIILEGERVIESRLVCQKPTAGVRIRTVGEALTDIMQRRKPVDGIAKGAKEFVVRRWYGETGR